MAEPVTVVGGDKSKPGTEVVVQKGSATVRGTAGAGGAVWINGVPHY